MSMDRFLPRNILGCYQNRNPSQTFRGNNLVSKNFKIFSPMRSLFRQNKGLSSTAQNSTKLSHRWFHEDIAAAKLLENIQINVSSGFLF